MTRFSQLTLRNFLIATHDAIATALALLAASFCASRASGSTNVCRCCCVFCPILSRSVSSSVTAFKLTTTKWRFISLPDALNILRVSSVLTLALLVLDYIFVDTGLSRNLLSRPDRHRPLLVSPGLLPERTAFRLPLFPLHQDAASCPCRQRLVDAADRPRRRCRDCVARDRKRRGEADVAGRRAVAVEFRPGPVDTEHSGPRRGR